MTMNKEYRKELRGIDRQINQIMTAAKKRRHEVARELNAEFSRVKKVIARLKKRRAVLAGRLA